MKALVRHAYGSPDVLAVEEVPTPAPGTREILIRVRAASLNLGDWELLTGTPPYIRKLARLFAPKPRVVVPSPPGSDRPSPRPKYKVLGSDIAGRVEAVGREVTRFRPGDEVFGDCGIAGFGGFAEYVCVPDKAALARKPPGMTFEQAAAIPQAAFIALQGLRRQAKVRPGDKVLINGAGGGAGTVAIRIAKLDGAEVTGVDGPTKLDLMRSLGADHVLDYTREEFTQDGKLYDVILDMAAHRSVFLCRRSLSPRGIYLVGGGSGTATWQSAFLGPLISLAGRRRVAMLLSGWKSDDLETMVDLFERGEVVPPVDRCYPLAEAADAFRRVGEGLALGKVVLVP